LNEFAAVDIRDHERDVIRDDVEAEIRTPGLTLPAAFSKINIAMDSKQYRSRL
jgi:hypothetical protein